MLAALLLGALLPVRLAAQELSGITPITIGEELELHSAVLGQPRRLAIYLPAEYRQNEEAYPVLYVIDGGLEQDFLHVAGTTMLNALWGRSGSVIMVGIETVDRPRELTGSTSDAALLAEYPTAGHSAEFRRFVREEVIPAMEARYRTNGQRGVIGESLAGLFIVESALEEPELFQRHAAISPSLWWDMQALAHRAEALLARRDQVPALYLTIANEGAEMQAGYDRLVEALSGMEPTGARWCSVPRPAEFHSTVYHTASPQALQFLFPLEEASTIEGFQLPCGGGAGDEAAVGGD